MDNPADTPPKIAEVTSAPTLNPLAHTWPCTSRGNVSGVLASRRIGIPGCSIAPPGIVSTGTVVETADSDSARKTAGSSQASGKRRYPQGDGAVPAPLRPRTATARALVLEAIFFDTLTTFFDTLIILNTPFTRQALFPTP